MRHFLDKFSNDFSMLANCLYKKREIKAVWGHSVLPRNLSNLAGEGE